MKIVLAMSGGVDSGCAGALLRRGGHEVIGVTMLIDGFPPSPAMDSGVKECCEIGRASGRERVSPRV